MDVGGGGGGLGRGLQSSPTRRRDVGLSGDAKEFWSRSYTVDHRHTS